MHFVVKPSTDSLEVTLLVVAAAAVAIHLWCAQVHGATVKNRESFQVVNHESLLWPTEACLSQYANSCM